MKRRSSHVSGRLSLPGGPGGVAGGSVTASLAPKSRVQPFIHAHALFLSAVTAGLLGERRRFQPDPSPPTLRPFGRRRLMAGHVLQMG